MLPAYFFAHFTATDGLDSLSTVWLPPTVGFVLTTIGFLVAVALAWGVGPWFGLDTDAKRRAFALCVGVANYGYIPLPLAERFYPEALTDLILHNVGVDLSLWSLGIAIIAGGAGGSVLRAILSAPMLAVLAAIAVRQTGTQIYIPSSVATAIDSLGDCAIPLGLLLSGAIIVDFIRTSSGGGGRRVIAAAIVVRQILLPIIMLTAATGLNRYAIGSTPSAMHNLQIVLMLQSAMPAAVFPIVLVRLYGQDTQTGLRVVLWTSVVSIVTIPLWIAIATRWLGIAT